MTALASAFCALLFAVPAHGAESGQIDYVEMTSDGGAQLLYSVPALPEGANPDLDTLSVTVDGKGVSATASRVVEGAVKRTVVLALDVSASMRGSRFEAAKEAATTYLNSAPADVAVGLVTFAGTVEVASSPTTDRKRLTAQIEAMELSQGTMLYDGILEAVAQTGAEGQRQVVVLSDGADTGSTPLADVLTTASAAGVTVNAVALEQAARHEAQLRQIAEASDGTLVSARDPEALGALLAAEAHALTQQILVEFAPATSGEASVAVSIEAEGRIYSDSTFTTLAARPTETETPRVAGPVPVPVPSLMVSDTLMLVALAAIAVALVLATAALLIGKSGRKESYVQEQLAYYSASSTTGSGVVHAGPTRQQFNMRESVVGLADHVVTKADLEARLNTRLGAAGIALSASEWLLLHTGIAVLGGLVGLLLSGGNVAAVLLLLFLGAAGPWVYVSLKRSRRLKAFNSQLADTLQLMSGGLSAGLSLPQAVDTVVREGAEPMAGELRRALVEQRLGVDIEDSLDGVADRMESKDFGWVVMAIRIQREVGGNLAELLNTVAGTLREREYLRRQVLTLSAEGRLSAWILGGLPPGFVAYLAVARGDYLAPLITTQIGWMISGTGLVMLAVGAFWLSKTVKVEV